MANHRVTVKQLKNHFVYSWWKYLLMLVLGCFGVDLLFSMTAYRAPEEKKIELYLCCSYADSTAVEVDFWPELHARCPDQEELTVLNINLASGDMYAQMQFSTYVAAQQGDVCLLPRSEFKKLTQEGADDAFLELTPYIQSGVIDAGDIDLSAGRAMSGAGEEGLYGIPADTLYGLFDYSCDPENSMLCIMAYSGNNDTAAATIDLLLEKLCTEKPEGYDEMRAAQKAAEQATTTQIFK